MITLKLKTYSSFKEKLSKLKYIPDAIKDAREENSKDVDYLNSYYDDALKHIKKNYKYAENDNIRESDKREYHKVKTKKKLLNKNRTLLNLYNYKSNLSDLFNN